MAALMVGSAFLSATIQTIAENLTSSEFRGFIKNTKFNKSLLEELKTTLFALQVVLVDAEQKQFNDLPVKQWLDDLKDAIFDAEDLLNLIGYDVLRCKMENTPVDQLRNLPSLIKINSKMEKMCKRLQTFVNQSNILGLQGTVSGRVSRRTSTSSVVNESIMVGRNDDKDRLIDMLVSESDRGTRKNNNLDVVAILGMGGIGKTTLAQLVYNDEKVEQHFDLKAWVCVSEEFDVMRVTKFLLESVARNTSAASNIWESNNLDILRVELKKISREKRFLFVLDDLWNDNFSDWEELVSPFINGKRGSSVIITTRQKNVADMAHTFPIHKLEPLSDEECWSIISKHAFRSDDFLDAKNTILETIGKKIAKKCGGLPIAAKTLGGLLRSKVDIEEWNSILNSNVWNLQNDNIMPALYLSYQYLPSHLKRCFAYCSIFPKDYPLDRKKLVLLWMAQGFLDCSQGRKQPEEVGNDFFNELLSRSLIQESNDNNREKRFFMHDLVNDLAAFVSGKSCCRLECGDIHTNVRHLSYNQEQYDIYKKFENLTDFKYLRSFLPINFLWSHYLSIKVVNDLLPTLKRLRVLSLSKYTNITSLPDSIGNLVQLRYLDLSHTGIESLPNIVCNLYNLQTLILSCCEDLTELPSHVGKLISLRHLDISGCPIKELPVEIGGLENLQTLTDFLVGKQHVGLSIKKLRKFSNLQGKLSIKNLHNVINVREAEYANLRSKEKVEELELVWGKQSEDSLKVKVVLDFLQPSLNLKSMKIDLYGGTSFPSWFGNSSFSNMVSLRISNCDYCMKLPPLGQLPSLKDLIIEGMFILETIASEFYCVHEGEGCSSSFQPFPSLECIIFRNMKNLNEWFPFEGNNFAFPRLRTLKLHDCPELKGHLPSHLSSIEEIVIEGCDHLLKTPLTLQWLMSIKNLRITNCAQTAQLSLLESDSLCLLQRVEINRCGTLMSMPRMILSSTCLKHLKLDNLPSLAAFPTDGLPTLLQSLDISFCKNLSFLPLETWSNYTSLVSLTLWSSCDELTSFPLDGFPALQTLSLCYYHKSIDSIFMLEASSSCQSSLQSLYIRTDDSIGTLHVKLRMDTLIALEHLYLYCGGELSFCEGVSLPSKLQSIYIRSRTTTAPPISEWGFQRLRALSSLRIGIGGDDKVNTLMKEALLPISLVTLNIYEVNSFDGNGLRHLSSLEYLSFQSCQQLESLPENCLPSSLKSLYFLRCDKLKSLPEDSLPESLEELRISKCPLLEERYKGKDYWSKIAHVPVIYIKDQLTI